MFNFRFIIKYIIVFITFGYGLCATAHHFADPYLELCASIRRLSRNTIPLDIFISGLSNRQRKMVFGVSINDDEAVVQVPGKSKVYLNGRSGQETFVEEYFKGHVILAYYYWKEVLSEKEFTALGWQEPSEEEMNKNNDSKQAVQERLRKHLTKLIIDKNKGCF